MNDTHNQEGYIGAERNLPTRRLPHQRITTERNSVWYHEKLVI